MQIVNLVPEFYPLWNATCFVMDEAWFWHTAEWLQYTLHYRPELQPRSTSFLVTSENRVLAICPLIIETHTTAQGGWSEFSYGGGPGPAPALANDLSPKFRKTVLRAVCNELDARARRSGVMRATFRTSPPAPAFWHARLPQPHPLVRFGFLDTPLATQVISLSKSEDELLNDMRKGHRYDVKRSQQLFQAKVYDATNITPHIFEQYRRLHQRAAGRTTRPLATFEMMESWIHKRMAILVLACQGENLLGCALISVYKDGAYYSSGCEDPQCGNLPVGHGLQWAAMQWMKKHSITHYEVGIQPCGVQTHSVFSEKESNIAKFKRGFGGETVAFWMGEKFYSRQYYETIMHNRVEQLASTMPAVCSAAV